MDSVTLPSASLASLVWHLSRRSDSKPASDGETSRQTASANEAEKKRKRALGDQVLDKASKEKIDVQKNKDCLPVTDPNWGWSTYDQYTDKQGRVQLTKREAKVKEETESGPFRVIHRNQANQQWPDEVLITLYSRPLRRIIAQYLPENGDLKTLAEPNIAGRELFIILDVLKSHKFNKDVSGEPENDGLANGNGAIEHYRLANGNTALKTHELTGRNEVDAVDESTQNDCSNAGREMEEGELHLKHLLRFMEKEYRDVPVRIHRMLAERKVSWDMLWAFLPCGKKVVYSCDHSLELLCAVVISNYFQTSMNGLFFVLELAIWEFDGRNYKKCPIRRQIPKYEGERSFDSLLVSPVELVGKPELLEEKFLDNGRKYIDLAMKHKHRFMHYNGPLFQQRLTGKGCRQLHKENADGRVMVDLLSFAKMNPDYPMGNAHPPTGSTRSVVRLSDGSYSIYSVGCDSLNASSSAISESVSDETLIFAPGIVYGFSFTLKMWGSFAIGGFRDISFDSSAFDQLVMEPQMKGLVHNLVSHYIATPVNGSVPLQRVDPISNKGNGCVFLCYGPPGTGKTLTAESLAETLGRPLWSLTVSELGTTPKELEKTLSEALDIAASWRAVLLLDEADVYLERRVSGANLTRNAMTGVFLRMLEYYRGVLFLTTNRISTFDEAFRSRISMFLHYSSLTIQRKEQIWKALLGKAKLTDVASEKLSELASLDLNGREIRNSIHTAQTWSQSKGETLKLEHVQYVLNVVGASLKSLNEALRAGAYK